MVLEKLSARTAEELSCHEWDAGLSIGAVTFLGAARIGATRWSSEADDAMYAAKRSGKDRTVLRVHPAPTATVPSRAPARRGRRPRPRRGGRSAATA